MEKAKKIYPSSQLVVALDAKVLKVYMWILAWQSHGSVKYFLRQFKKATKLEEDEIDRCIQALVNAKLIKVESDGESFLLTPNAEQAQKYFEIPLNDVLDGNGIKMADTVTWNREAEVKPARKAPDDMSEEEMKKTILMLQARLKEKEEVKKMVVNYQDDLPY